MSTRIPWLLAALLMLLPSSALAAIEVVVTCSCMTAPPKPASSRQT